MSAEHKKAVDAIRAENDKLVADAAAKAKEHDEHVAALVAVRTQLDKREKEGEAHTRAAADLKTALDAAQQELERLKASSAEVSSRLAKSEHDAYAAAEKLGKEHSAALDALRAELEQQQAAVLAAKLGERDAEHKAALDALKADLDRSHAEITRLKSQMDKTNGAMRAKLEAEQKKGASAAKELAETQAALEKARSEHQDALAVRTKELGGEHAAALESLRTSLDEKHQAAAAENAREVDTRHRKALDDMRTKLEKAQAASAAEIEKYTLSLIHISEPTRRS